MASVFNITLGIVSWWTSKESERYNRLIQLRVFAFCLNILHAYITGPIIYQNDDVPLMAPGRNPNTDSAWYTLHNTSIQGWPKECFPGLVNFVTAIAYRFLPQLA